jgi:hypothetical protein
MPRYFFRIYENGRLLEGETCEELISIEAAVNEAKRAIREILADKVMQGHLPNLNRSGVEILDHKRRFVRSLPYRGCLATDDE